MPMQKISLSKTEKIQIKTSDIFHISAQNIDCGYSLEPPRRFFVMQWGPIIVMLAHIFEIYTGTATIFMENKNNIYGQTSKARTYLGP